ncbi:MAG: S41 family peptidase [Cyanobacteria bacterium P01_H01_bin.15]
MLKRLMNRVCWAGILLSVWLNWGVPQALAAPFSNYSDEQQLLLQAWRIVNQAYLDDSFNNQNWWFLRQRYLDRSYASRSETYEAIRELLSSLDDPFTRLLEPSQYRNLQFSTAGELTGVGLQININPESGQLEVVSPISGSPAEAAGLKPRDQILEIDGVATQTLSLDEAAIRMRGPIGTEVVLNVLSPLSEAAAAPRDITIRRDRITLSALETRLQDGPNGSVGYLRLNQFTANAAEEMTTAITNLSEQGAQGFVLDLRNNPGGLLTAGIDIARLWLDGGTVVYTVNRQGMLDSFDDYTSASSDAPLVLLVNQGTASASEILAGALQDNGRAVVVGEQTFGKGLIQSLFELSDGAGLAVTVAKYETPAHHDINKLGITPDVVVPLTEVITYADLGTELDVQYQQALEYLSYPAIAKLSSAN